MLFVLKMYWKSPKYNLRIKIKIMTFELAKKNVCLNDRLPAFLVLNLPKTRFIATTNLVCDYLLLVLCIFAVFFDLFSHEYNINLLHM